ncbi:MAG TPA: hypothetical protein VNB86_00365 [Gaiellaceae bacterium]|nr:hypothetical protein [Gaiellaceae bacterium]
MSRPLAAAMIAAGVLVVVLAVALYAGGEIVEHGHLLPWAGDDVRKVRFFDRFDLYVSSETGKPSADLINSYLLVAAASGCFAAALLLYPPSLRPLLLVAGFGLGYLAIDEQFAVHETVGHNLGFLADLPGVERPDDVILATYAIPSALFIYVFWRQLRQSMRAVVLLVSALALFAVSALWDLADLPAEELFELAPSLAILGAFAFLTYDFARVHRAPA